MRRQRLALAVLLATVVALVGVRGVQDQEPPLTLAAALGEHAASAPLLAGAEAALANRCLERLGLSAVMPTIAGAPASPFTGDTPSATAPSLDTPAPSAAESVALFGSPEAAVVSVRDPDRRELTTSSEGCLSEARAALFGSVRRYLVVTATQRWLLDEWREGLGDAAGEPLVRDRLQAWTHCAIADGWPEDVTLADVYRVDLLPLPSELEAESAWKSERYCRVSSGVMSAFAQALDRAPANGIDTDLLHAFVSDLQAARDRAAELIET